jgi:rhodanese-related sulfurtransferase/DNA-binding transcriptional ArsR family regulator
MINKTSAAVGHYDELARLGKALASPVRLRMLDLLRQGARTVEALADAAGVSVANASRHLQAMRAARIVTGARQGQFVEYRVADEGVSRAYGVLRELAEQLLPELERLRRELGGLAPAERDELLRRIRRGDVTLVDVRPAEEYRAGHLPGAHSIPLGELRGRLGELPRDREVVAYCRGPYCTLAADAVALLASAGFRARHLDLGVPDLRVRRFPVVAGEPPPRPARPRRSSRRITPGIAPATAPGTRSSKP